MDEALASLEKEYCPPVDPALFAAIVSDFDFTSPEAITEARETLDAIKSTALEEDSTGFDPSGNAASSQKDKNEQTTRTVDISSEGDGSQSQCTGITSVSNDVRSLSLDSDLDKENRCAGQHDTLDDVSKAALLKEMFPDSSEFAISYTLNKCNGSWNRALEELLNHTFFNSREHASEGEEVVSSKGLDAFSEDRIVRRSKKKKQSSRRIPPQIEGLSRASSLPPPSAWERSKTDIDFLESRTNTPRKSLYAMYHKNGASLQATIYALIESSPKLYSAVSPNDEVMKSNAIELGKDFPALSPAHVHGLVRLTHPSTAAAHELAKTLVSLDTGMARGGIEVIPRYAPVNIDAEDSKDDLDWRAARKQWAQSSSSSTPTYLTTSEDPASQANQYLAASQRSFAQASSAYRRGKSNHLMSAAAGYYSQQGRDFAAKYSEATAEAADALVQSQSTKDEIDLHGVSVKDAVRISQTRVQAWWREHGKKVKGLDGRVRVEDGMALDRSQAFRIVTGVGRHSSGGRGKIGPAVGRVLANEGWNFRAEEGVLTVYGKRA